MIAWFKYKLVRHVATTDELGIAQRDECCNCIGARCLIKFKMVVKCSAGAGIEGNLHSAQLNDHAIESCKKRIGHRYRDGAGII